MSGRYLIVNESVTNVEPLPAPFHDYRPRPVTNAEPDLIGDVLFDPNDHAAWDALFAHDNEVSRRLGKKYRPPSPQFPPSYYAPPARPGLVVNAAVEPPLIPPTLDDLL